VARINKGDKNTNERRFIGPIKMWENNTSKINIKEDAAKEMEKFLI